MSGGGPRIVIVGAGGWVFPLELIRDLFSFPALRESTLVLYDIDAPAAERTGAAARELIGIGRLPAGVEVSTDLRGALRGADVVITVFQVGGVEAYGFDVEIPREYGVDQTVGDTLGPGGVFRGLRTVAALRVVAEAMLESCPDALLLNYANPMSVNCWATDLLGVRMVGLCHSVQGTSELLARELGVPYEEVTFDCAGVNHTAWFTTFRRGDEDLLPRIREVMRARHVDGTTPLLPRGDDAYESTERVRAELMLLTGYFHTESSHHASEYWAWFRRTPELVDEYLDRRWDYLAICRAADAASSNREVLVEARPRASGTAASSPRRSSTASSPGRPRVVYGNVRNGGCVENLPGTRVSRWRAWPTPAGFVRCGSDRLPPACAALNNVQIASQRLRAGGDDRRPGPGSRGSGARPADGGRRPLPESTRWPTGCSPPRRRGCPSSGRFRRRAGFPCREETGRATTMRP